MKEYLRSSIEYLSPTSLWQCICVTWPHPLLWDLFPLPVHCLDSDVTEVVTYEWWPSWWPWPTTLTECRTPLRVIGWPILTTSGLTTSGLVTSGDFRKFSHNPWGHETLCTSTLNLPSGHLKKWPISCSRRFGSTVQTQLSVFIMENTNDRFFVTADHSRTSWPIPGNLNDAIS